MSGERDAAVALATQAINKTAATYETHLKDDVAAIKSFLDAGDIGSAQRRTQNIVGEAPGFGWPAAGEAAAVLRSILEADEQPKRAEATVIAMHALAVITTENKRTRQGGGEKLLNQLNMMADKLGITA
ncbi:MAG: hypothetical protein AAGC95_07535 [Pseudomonadota bacterium]